MTKKTPQKQLEAFVAEGNTIIGPWPTKFIGNFDILWKEPGAVLEFGADVTLSSARLVFGAGGGSMSFEKGSTIKGRLEANRGGRIRVGEGTFLNRICDIRGAEGATVDIGMNCLFADVTIQTSDMHAIIDCATRKRTNPAASVVIEDDVWIAADTKIGKGTRVGTGAVIAAGSLVTRPIAPYCLAVGRPAKVVRTGITWRRAAGRMQHLDAVQFQPDDIPLEKEALRLLMSRKQHALVEAVIIKNETPNLPLFARWYLVSAKHKLGRPHPDAKAILDQIIQEAPNHAAARKLRETYGD
ncbi:hypothetical protein MUY21_06890 [Aliiroseovarius sp. S2029]|uniref:hypothetical protein n=1 Tax=Aliiroseovarius sp. S2029 TaxID=2936988 RepID=UPI0020BF6348|nr:hypothetical protein [Aliiroseovarius sp. S2029]MCK8483760.1 hypothetical protein [Aliiroseovarius sp. S2029]